ncbi:hypothetical protein OG230_08200 [Streptomyces sp. NBC_00234]|uniref:hypothetical protein n=1 Tax=Streptomyces sp. NBC_00234 TaxID=2903638 RepID=UPI002E2A4A43|nr:hypothetical protein [Streptomyces sp. NBC_00234]
MTKTPLESRSHSPVAPPVGPGRARTVLRNIAIASCLPYLALKTAWIAGSHVGIPDGSSLLDQRTTMVVANGATMLMDGSVVLIALLLTQARGLRVPAWLMALPMWVATGLLLPIMTGFPVQLLVALLGGGTPSTANAGRRPFLDDWVFGVVYTGFIVQGLALGALFVLYATDRWGHLWQGALRDLPDSPTTPVLRLGAVVVTVLALVPGTMHLLWAAGSTAALNATRIEERTSGFYALQAVDVLFVAATVAGVLLLAFRRGGRLPLRVPLALAWGGSAALACWGGWMSIASLTEVQEIGDQPTTGMVLLYAVRMLVGALVVTQGAYFFAERSAAAARPSGPRR